MNTMSEFALIIGDIHIPQRAASLPEKFRDLLIPGKMQYVISPGNVGSRDVSEARSSDARFAADRGVAREPGCGEKPVPYREG